MDDKEYSLKKGLSNMRENLKKKVLYTISTGLLAGSLSFMPAGTPKAHAMDDNTWNILAQTIETTSEMNAQYSAIRDQIIAYGNNVVEQNNNLKQSVGQYGLDTNLERNERVSKVMNQLIQNGDYALDSNQLPFRWRVVDTNVWNAGCYPTNYIQVNRGLIEDLTDDNSLAFVFAHEMTHGLHRHFANDKAQQVLYKYGADLLTQKADYIQSQIAAFVTNYITVKNTTNTSEADADETGFYIATTAGFNPGGGAIETLHMLAIDNSSNDIITDFFKPSDHPFTKTRFERMEKRMEEYGFNHVKVQNGTDVYIDGQKLLTANATDKLKAYENAYLIAGGISKGLHDKKMAYEWYFNDKTGDFLDNSPAYKELKAAIKENGLYATFQTMIDNAYNLDRKDKDRAAAKAKVLADEKEKHEAVEKVKAEIVKYKDYSSEEYRTHFYAYQELGLNKLAFAEMQKSYNVKQSYITAGSLAEAYSHLNTDYAKVNNAYNPEYTQMSIKYGEEGLSKAPANHKDWIVDNLGKYYYQAQNPTKVAEMQKMMKYSTTSDKMAKYDNAFVGRLEMLNGNKDMAIKYFVKAVRAGYSMRDVPENITDVVKAGVEAPVENLISENE